MHWWPWLPPRWRRNASITFSAAGLAFLLAGTAAEGMRETATTATLVLGPTYRTATTAAASLHYYVLTVVCLLLGFTGLALGDRLAGVLRERYLLSAVAVAWLVTVMRFLLERSAAPTILTESVGVTWMAPVAGAWVAYCIRDDERTPAALLRPLVAYAFLVRTFVALVAVVATRLHLGTHYDVSPIQSVVLPMTGAALSFDGGSWTQILWLSLLPQLVVWPAFTVAAGLAGGLLLWRWLPRRTPRRASSPPADVLAARERS
jgi:hypothetical protein